MAGFECSMSDSELGVGQCMLLAFETACSPSGGKAAQPGGRNFLTVPRSEFGNVESIHGSVQQRTDLYCMSSGMIVARTGSRSQLSK